MRLRSRRIECPHDGLGEHRLEPSSAPPTDRRQAITLRAVASMTNADRDCSGRFEQFTPTRGVAERRLAAWWRPDPGVRLVLRGGELGGCVQRLHEARTDLM